MSKRAFRSVLIAAIALVLLPAGLAIASGPPSSVSGLRAEPAIRALPDVSAQPTGFSPAQIQASYALSTSPYAGVGQTIAIVDAYDNPNVASDLVTFDAYWGLPSCGNACFAKVDQNGGTNYPSQAPTNWALETAMDVEWVHAVAPGARVLLVEASSDNLGDLLAAERYAGANANYVSNSWGFPEFSGETTDTAVFADPGVSYFAAVKDAPGETQYPATDPHVVAVGGDQLTASGVVPWAGGGGGCSAYEQASSVEATAASQAGCSGNQPTPAVSAVAANIPIFDLASGWLDVGGTSFATALWAAAAADSGQLVTGEILAEGLVPLQPVLGGTLLKTGFGGLAAIPHTFGEELSIAVAMVEGAA